MQVKVFNHTNWSEFEITINKFIENRDVIDIKYLKTTTDDRDDYSAMILYNNKKI